MYKTIETKVDAFVDRLIPSRRGGVTGYLIASVVILVGLFVRLMIAPIEAGLPYLTFFPAVTLAAILGGFRAGLFALVGCSIIVSYMFIPPFQAFALTFSANVIFTNVVFYAEELVVIIIIEAMYRQRSNYVTTADLLEQIKMSKQELQLSAAAFEAHEGIMITDANGMILRVNKAFTEISGYLADEVIGQTPRLLKSGRHDKAFYTDMWESIQKIGEWQGEIWDRHKNGEIYPKWMTITAVKAEGDAITHYVAMQTDISARKAAEAEIASLAYFDPLTGLPNRRMFQDRLEQEIKKADRTRLPLALLMIDLDHFKEVNDTLGHNQGDILLQDATKRLLGCIRESDTLARLGGDEFIVILNGLKEVKYSEQVAQSIVNAMLPPFSLREELSYISASVGITIYPNDTTAQEQLLKNADQAMYSAKSQGRSCYSYFTQAMQEAAQSRLHLTNDLRAALPRREFEIHYQPIVELATGSIHKAEALIRWNHPVMGLISPAQFIPLAEDSGMINEIGDWVFREAVTQVKRWRENGHPDFQVSVNKSPVQFHSSNNSHKVWMEFLRALALPGESLVVEITEGLLMESKGASHQKLFEFRDAGIQVAIDDFGTGYSALSYLNKFDIDYLKIDQSFVRNMTINSCDIALCKAIIGMAHELGLKVIAEGVETEVQRNFLANAGCDYAQGYFYARPMATGDFDAWLLANDQCRTICESAYVGKLAYRGKNSIQTV